MCRVAFVRAVVFGWTDNDVTKVLLKIGWVLTKCLAFSCLILMWRTLF